MIYKNIPEYIDIYVYIKNNKWCVGYYNNNNNGNSELIVEDTEADAKGLLLLDLIDSNIISIESIVL